MKITVSAISSSMKPVCMLTIMTVSLPACFNVWLASEEADFVKNKFLYTSWDVDEMKSRADEIASSRKFNIDLVGWPFEGKMEDTWKS